MCYLCFSVLRQHKDAIWDETLVVAAIQTDTSPPAVLEAHTGDLNMEVRVRRKAQTSKHEAREKNRERVRARSRPSSDQQYLVVSQWSFTTRVRSVLRSLVTRLRQSVFILLAA
ncbi:hypothetical protein Q7C36_012072 [Tachysurus vachellii]|uniref:Uncharacterized protein n=1 Tax=Tachysurus vachellii TaxID=175792 RepID=A0AA88SPS7_TACVA|nr:hypothetical protein Q7C36_012072 [Tachysurus vachellii]